MHRGSHRSCHELSAARYTTIYVKRDERWRAIALHMTSLEAT
jgi:hypothetical protein